jgi:hypothetical protein
MTLPAAREQETTQQPGDIILGAPAASEVSMPPSDPTQMVNHQLVPAAGSHQLRQHHSHRIPGEPVGPEGDLTIKDITRPVELLTEFTGSAIDNLGNAKVAFLAQARISRHDFGLTHELRNEAGSLLVRRDVTLCFAVEAIRTSTLPH